MHRKMETASASLTGPAQRSWGTERMWAKARDVRPPTMSVIPDIGTQNDGVRQITKD